MHRTGFLAIATLLASGCTEQGPPATEERGRGLSSAAHRSIQLAERSAWRRLNPNGPFLVSPEFSPRGDWILASGGLGRGRFLVQSAGARVLAVDPRFNGASSWVQGGDAVCLERGRDLPTARYHLSTGRFREGPSDRCRPVHWDEELGRRIHRDAGLEVFHHARFGTITVREGPGRTRVLEDRGAWGARVSPDGQRVAYCQGTLAEPELFVADLTGRVVRVGRGAHPAWAMGGRFLLYATVDRVVRSARRAAEVESDLGAFDTRTQTSVRLTRTPAVSEMNPEVSPRGDAVAFSDWRTGALYMAPLFSEGQP